MSSKSTFLKTQEFPVKTLNVKREEKINKKKQINLLNL